MGPDREGTSEYICWYNWALLSGTGKAHKNLILDREFPAPVYAPIS